MGGKNSNWGNKYEILFNKCCIIKKVSTLEKNGIKPFTGAVPIKNVLINTI